MKKLLTTLALAGAITTGAQAQFASTNLLLLRVGDGTTALANTNGAISLLELTRSGTVVQTINIATNSLQISGTATSEGQMSLSPDGSILTIAGYVPPFAGTGSLSSRTAANAPRGYVTVSASGTVSGGTIVSNAYSTDNIRSGVTVDGSSFWFTGSSGPGSGIMAFSGGATNQIADINSRVIKVYNNDLFYSTGSGVQGIYRISGTPTSSNAAPVSILTGVTSQGTSPYDFAFSADGNTLYVADDGIGVQKFTNSGSAWSLAYNLTNGLTQNRAYGLEVLFGATNQVLWTSPTNVWSVLDEGFATNATSIYTPGANYALRGLEATVVPEPGTYALLALAGAGFAAYRFRRRARR
jgi:hypothetical protein